MKKIVIFTCLLLSLSLTSGVFGDVLIDLDASSLPDGDLTSWANAGTAGGIFLTADRPDDAVVDPNALVTTIDGKKAVLFTDGAWMESDITAPAALTGADSPWTVMVWADANSVAATGEDSLFQWADRGYDGGNTAEFNFGTRACTFWDDVFYTNPPATGEWVHLAYTYDGTDVRLYINGLPDTVAAKTLDMADGDYMRIARAMPDVYGTHPYTGAIASIQVHDVALSRAEIQDAMGAFVEAGELTPTGLTLMEGNGGGNITLQIKTNNLTSAGPTSDLEVTLSFAGAYTDAALGTSAVGDPYVVTVPAATYNVPIIIPIVAEDDLILEGTHQVLVQAVVTAGDPAYQAATILPAAGLAVTIQDNDFLPCPELPFSNGSYLDDFDCPWDFTQGVTGLWDGLVNAGNVISAQTVFPSGILTFDGTGDWVGNITTGPFLYTEVTGDFEAEVHLVAPVTSAGGLMVRLGDPAADGDAGEDNMWLAAWSSWDVGGIFWPVDNGDRPEWDITWDGATGPTWMKVKRQGAEFYWSRSYDGVNWMPIQDAYPLVRDDMNVPTLQVGLPQSFGGDPIEYDYFKLSPSRGSVSGDLNLTESIEESGTVQLQLDPTGFPAPLADINVELSAVRVGGDPNTEPNDIMIGTALKGVPYAFTIPAANYDQPQLIDVKAVSDTDPELDQLLTLVADVNSTDPNWSGLLISSNALINVMEEPGMLIDEGDGVEVTEGGPGDSFTVRLKTDPGATPLEVAITDIADPNEVTATPLLTFTETDFWIPQTVSVAAIDDGDLEYDHGTTLSLVPSGAVLPTPLGDPLPIVNGDFNTGYVLGANIDGWASVTTGNFWDNAFWDSPSGDPLVNMSINPSATSGDSTNPLSGAWFYQNINSLDGVAYLQVQLDWGSFGAPSPTALRVALYEDTAGTFVQTNDVDVEGALTLVGAQTLSGVSGTDVLMFDLSGVGAGNNLFLRINNYDPGTGTQWTYADNISLYASSVGPPEESPVDVSPASVDVSILDNECGAWGYSTADTDEDCDVDIVDLQALAGAWLDCSNPYDSGCVDYRP